MNNLLIMNSPILQFLNFSLKGPGHVLETNFFRNDDFAVFLIGHITEIFHYFSRNEGVVLKMDSLASWRNKRSTRMLYDCRDIGGFLEITYSWSHPIHQNLCRTQWAHVGSNIDYRDNRFVYGYVTLPL